MRQKFILPFLTVTFMFMSVGSSCSFAQALDKIYAKTITLAGNGTDVSHGVTLTAPTLGSSVTVTLPAVNRIGPLTNDGAGNLNWGGPTGIVAGTPNQFLITNGNLLPGVAWQTFTTNTSLQGNGVGTALGINLGNANAWTAAQTIQQNALGTTPTDALVLTNSSSAANNSQQYSPRLHFGGRGWGGSSQSVDWIMQAVPVQGTTNPSSYLDFKSSINGASYTSQFDFYSSGGASVGVSTPSDPGAGVINAQIGFKVNNAAANGSILLGNGTSFVPSSATFPTSTSSGQTGNIIWSNSTGNGFSCAPVTTISVTPTNPTGTTSQTPVMMGLGTSAQITPAGSGIILIIVSGTMSYSPTTTDGDSVTARLYYADKSNISVPSNGASPVGTAIGSTMKSVMANGLNQYSFSLNAIVGGGSPLAVGHTYWVDVAVSEPAGGVTGAITNLTISAIEL